MASRKDLTDQELIRFLRFSVTESAAATFTQQSYDTQLSIDRGLIWMITWIEFELQAENIDDPAAAGTEHLTVQITRESKTAMLTYDDPDLIELVQLTHDRSAAIGTDAGPMYWQQLNPYMIQYPIPIPYSGRNIYVAAVSTAGAAKTFRGRIAYTLRRVTDKFFYRVAQALIS